LTSQGTGPAASATAPPFTRRQPCPVQRWTEYPQGNPWVVNDRGEVLRRNRNGTWQRLAGRGTAVTIATNGTAWLIGRDRVPGGYSVHRWTGQGWRRVNGGAVALAAGPVPWLVNSDGQIYVWTGKR